MRSDIVSNTQSVFSANDYRSFVRESLAGAEKIKRTGYSRKLALALKCHPTFISQVAREKAHFSNEQAIGFCQFFHFSETESEFFLDLVNRDRSGTIESRAHFEKRLERIHKQRLNLQYRWKTQNPLSLEQRLRYYESWVPQAVHMATGIQSLQKPEEISKKFRMDTRRVLDTLKMLEEFGLVAREKDRYIRTANSLHLEKTSPLNSKLHSNWRLKSSEEVSHPAKERGIHYTSIATLSEKSARKLNEMIIKHLEECRKEMIESQDQEIYVHTVDFFKL